MVSRHERRKRAAGMGTCLSVDKSAWVSSVPFRPGLQPVPSLQSVSDCVGSVRRLCEQVAWSLGELTRVSVAPVEPQRRLFDHRVGLCTRPRPIHGAGRRLSGLGGAIGTHRPPRRRLRPNVQRVRRPPPLQRVKHFNFGPALPACGQRSRREGNVSGGWVVHGRVTSSAAREWHVSVPSAGG